MKTIILLICVMISCVVLAQEKNIDNIYSQNRERMEVIVQAIAKSLNKSQKAEFEEAQKKWKLFSESEARFRAGITSGGGSAYSYDYLNNLISLTDERIKELSHFYEQVKYSNADE